MTPLRLVGAPVRLSWGGLEVSISDDVCAPIDALIVEEDTFLVLSAPPEIPPSSEHPVRVFTALTEAEPLELGAIRVRGGAPLLIQAVVIDLEQDPPASLAAVRSALAAALSELGRRKLRRAGLELLGSIHGGLDPAQVVDVLKGALAALPPGSLEQLSLVARHRDLDRIAAQFRGTP